MHRWMFTVPDLFLRLPGVLKFSTSIQSRQNRSNEIQTTFKTQGFLSLKTAFIKTVFNKKPSM